jgi:hypothetical protein
VKLLQRITVFLVLALWLVATQHCKLEKITGLEFLRCASDTATQSDCEGDSCASVEGGDYKLSDNQRVAPVLLMVAAVALPIAEVPAATECCSKPPPSPPPEIPKAWQFITRTASPPRAPSFAS